MELRNWVTETFGGTGKTLLDERVYSSEELRKDIIKLEHEQKRLEDDLDGHRKQYKALIKEGANASEMQRKKLAQKAKLEKKKLAIKKKKYRANNVKLGTMLSVQGMREIMDSQDVAGDADLAFDEVMGDANAQELQGKIVDRMAAFGVEMEDIQEISDALDVPILDDQLEVDSSDEEELMKEMAASGMSEEEIDVEDELDDEVGVDVGVGETEFDDLDDVDIDESELEI